MAFVRPRGSCSHYPLYSDPTCYRCRRWQLVYTEDCSKCNKRTHKSLIHCDKCNCCQSPIICNNILYPCEICHSKEEFLDDCSSGGGGFYGVIDIDDGCLIYCNKCDNYVSYIITEHILHTCEVCYSKHQHRVSQGFHADADVYSDNES